MIAVGIAFVVTYYFKEKIFLLLMEPFIKVMPLKSSFIFTGITEAFVTYFKISIVGSLFLVLPVILYEFWSFDIARALRKGKTLCLSFHVLGQPLFSCRNSILLFRDNAVFFLNSLSVIRQNL